jgi:hypothetical protein
MPRGRPRKEVVQRRMNMPHTLLNTAPQSVSVWSGTGWYQRPWMKGEREEYIKTVLRPHERY